MSITTKQLEQLRGAVANRVPVDNTVLRHRQLDLRNPEDPQVQLLAKLCEPATFGRNQEDLLDETYRKAGKMDIENFAMSIDLGQLQIPDKISSELLVDGRPFRWELYKLNVYELIILLGPGSFFKAHKDTPRSEAMFGSLVLGGELLLRTKEEVWTYDSAATLALQNEPSIGYVAFFGDIEHEVLPVESGHRITLTYNLFFAPEPAPATLAGLLKDPDFLTDGGLVGWGLKYEYPVSTTAKREAVQSVSENLKGEDALVARISASLGLKAVIKVYIDFREMWEDEYSEQEFDDETWVDGLGLLMRSIPSLDSIGDESIYYYLRSAYGHYEVLRANEPAQPHEANASDDDSDDESGETATPQTCGRKKPKVRWPSEPTHACTEVPFASFGTEAQLNFIYGSFCLIIDIPSYATRKSGEA
ncbi:hypothetical protein PLEOSDRAFT_49007 [Pleurotus ostreatus PC15]|uniref:Fe2OG dioxygenase domain-containing protein n=1 Tax=Pleurotus ostreatus (strain PC15) TaxID=1137138 RepID=A0A067NYN2_PLEO1|nr:hypothetical protein PLEOSDRAFT_49007 [Pleurotus ostreatus PC15]